MLQRDAFGEYTADGGTPKVMVAHMKIEVVYIEGCPHLPAAIEAVKKAMEQHALTCPIIETKVEDQGMAVSIGFLGSPTVRINGLDIEPSARQRVAFGMMLPQV